MSSWRKTVRSEASDAAQRWVFPLPRRAFLRAVDTLQGRQLGLNLASMGTLASPMCRLAHGWNHHGQPWGWGTAGQAEWGNTQRRPRNFSWWRIHYQLVCPTQRDLGLTDLKEIWVQTHLKEVSFFHPQQTRMFSRKGKAKYLLRKAHISEMTFLPPSQMGAFCWSSVQRQAGEAHPFQSSEGWSYQFESDV